MFVPFHADGVISQFEGYEDLEELDWDGLRARYGNIQRLDRILRAEGDDPNRYKAAKQADTLMLFYLFPDAELRRLFAQLGYDLPPDVVEQDHRLLRPADLPRLDAEPHRPCRRPREHRSGELVGTVPRRAAQRRRRHPGRDHRRGHPHGRDGRDARPRPADLPRRRDPRRRRLLHAEAARAARRALAAHAVPRHADPRLVEGDELTVEALAEGFSQPVRVGVGDGGPRARRRPAVHLHPPVTRPASRSVGAC